MSVSRLRRGWQIAWLALALAGATGCRHKAKVAVIPLPQPQQLPVDTTAKVEEPQPWVQKVPLQPGPLTSVTVPTKKKVRKPRKTVAPAVPLPGTVGTSAPVQVASAGPVPEINPIGALTPGGNEGPQLRKQATDLIAALEKRLEKLPATVKKNQKDQIVRVLNFRRQAQEALAAGDWDGALTLATKAKVLLDDLEK